MAAAGFSYIELAGRKITALSDSDFARLLIDAEAWGIPCHALNAYCPPEIRMAGPLYDRARAKSYAELCAQRAAKLGVRFVGIGSPHSRILPEEFDKQLAYAQMSEFLTDTAQVFAGYSITINLEALGPCYCNFINTQQEAIRLINNLALPNIRLVLDFYNMERSGEGDAELASILPLTAHIHMSDDDGSPQQRSFLREERRAVHIRRVAQLQAAGYTGGISIETDLPFHMELAKHSLSILQEGLAALS